MNRDWVIPCGVLTVVAICACVGLTLIGGLTGAVYLYYQVGPTSLAMITPVPYGTPSPSPVVIRPTPITPTPLPVITGSPTLEASPTETSTPTVLVPTDTLLALRGMIIPTSDPIELAQRLQGLENFPRTLVAPSTPYQVGEEQYFWISNNNDENVRVQATLQYITEHSYFWIENGVSYSQSQLRDLADTFEQEIYPTNREFFGSEWSPGVDSDPHIYILYARGIGDDIAGYFSSADEYPPQVNQYSNSHEMFVFNADNSPLSDEYTYGVLAHEFQHMIHWYQDRNEASWLNEGFAELAVLLNGYYSSGFDWMYTSEPDMQLNNWPDDSVEDTTPHYGASFLFVTYFLDRFGETATQALVAHPDNDLDSVDAVLREINAVDTRTGQLISADDVFLDWTITNYLLDNGVGDGRYNYHSYLGTTATEATETITTCPVGEATRDVHQYGVDYINFTCAGTYNLHFEGSIQINVVPENPHSGDYAFWSNKSDESDMSLTRSFDFTNQSGPLALTYWTWYDIEEDWDYLYVIASIDGEHWDMLNTPSGTADDPIGNNYGWGYTGMSGGGSSPIWIQESVDLSQYAGRTVQLRFEYVTDASVTGEGFLLDDVAVPAIGYSTDFEIDDGGWEAAGWVRMQNILPQTYRLALITSGRSSTTVQYIPMNPDVTADIPFTVGGDVSNVVLVVTGTTRFTRQMAPYSFWVNIP
jgi:immune inhibitor A